jgi:hypothetical protein
MKTDINRKQIYCPLCGRKVLTIAMGACDCFPIKKIPRDIQMYPIDHIFKGTQSPLGEKIQYWELTARKEGV